MNFLRIFELLGFIIDFYLLLISIRIVLTWFGNPIQFNGIQYFMRITDPYLNIFRRIPGLRIGFIDFSVLLGIFLLVFLSRLLRVYGQGVISLSITIQVLLQTIVSGISSVLMILSILVIIRIVSLYIQKASFELIVQRFDNFLQPIISGIARKVMPGREITYKMGLFSLLCIFFLGGYIIRFIGIQIIILLQNIPF